MGKTQLHPSSSAVRPTRVERASSAMVLRRDSHPTTPRSSSIPGIASARTSPGLSPGLPDSPSKANRDFPGMKQFLRTRSASGRSDLVDGNGEDERVYR